jgi:hypothetical protein
MNVFADIGAGQRALLIIAAVGLAAAILAFVPSPLGLFDLFDAPPVPEVKAPPPLVMAPMPAMSTFDAVAERPLFNADRKSDPLPPQPKAPTPAIVLGDLMQYRLLGVTGDRQTQRALVQKTGGALLTLKPGDAFEGWTVEDINMSGVAISGGDRKEVLTIPKAQNAAQSP